MQLRKNTFLRHLLTRHQLASGVVWLLTILMISNLAACTNSGPGTPPPVTQRSSTSSSTTQPVSMSTPTQVLQPLGPDAGLYIGNAQWDNNADNAVYRLDYRSGKVLWKYQFLPDSASSQGSYVAPSILLVQQGYVFVESQGSVIYAIATATGKRAWSYTFKSSIVLVRAQESLPVLDQGILYIPGVDDEKKPDQDLLYAFDAQTGKLIHTYQSVRTFTVLNGTLYASNLDYDHTLRAVDLKSEKELWHFHLADQVFTTPQVQHNSVYVVTNKQPAPTGVYVNTLYALDATTGTLHWQSPTMTGGPVYDLTLSDNTIFCGEFGGSLFAYDAASGQKRWSQNIGFASNLLVAKDQIYATFNPGSVDPASGNLAVPGIMSLNASTGAINWKKILITGDPKTDTITAVLAHDAMLYISQNKTSKGQTSNQTMALTPDGKKVLWQIDIGSYQEGMVLLPD